jgi:trans-aconitate methyltransferase
MKWDAKLYDEVEGPQVDAGRELVRIARVNKADRILDLGCGTGIHTLELASLAPEGQTTGIDRSPEMLKRACEKAKTSSNVSFVKMDARSISFNGEFDLVFSNSALNWIHEQAEVLQLIHRSLKSGGRIALLFAEREALRNMISYTDGVIASLGLGRFYVRWKPPWYQATMDEYKSLLEEAGFREINVSHMENTFVFENVNEAINWWSATGLRPYLEPLPEKEQEYLRYALAMNFENKRTEKGIEFNLRRLIALAKK